MNKPYKYYSVTIRFDTVKHRDLIDAINAGIENNDTDRSKVVRELMRRGIGNKRRIS